MLFVSFTDLTPRSVSCGIELRLDKFLTIDWIAIALYIQNTPSPVLLTWRGPIDSIILEKLISVRPSFIDLEWTFISPEIAKKMTPTISWIISYHNFETTPQNLEDIYASMCTTFAYTYKIATFCTSTLDALRLLCFAKKHANISAICMGDKGSFGRVLGPIVGNLVNYAAFTQEQILVQGQHTLDELLATYHFLSLSPKTAIYGLIGSPVTQSIGHIHHNQVFRKNQIDAVYVKMDVLQSELPQALSLFQELCIQGLSVTIPLKEVILPFVQADNISQEIGSVNTLRFQNGAIQGTNTDAPGAIVALQEKTTLEGKTVVILGAGGAARALIYALRKQKANVKIVNRTQDKAKQLAEQFHCEYGNIPAEYDIIIDCTAHTAPCPTTSLLNGKIAMDIHIAKETPFLKIARERGCELIYGTQMFYAQAALQTKFWNLCIH